MQLTHLGHAAVLVETDTARLLIDPGNVSDAWHGVTDLDAILVTHQHADHVDPEHAATLVAANPSARVLVEPSVAEAVPLNRAEVFAAGDSTEIGGLTITGVGGEHAVIHPDIPGIGNTGLLIGAEGEPTLFHPGDALTAVPTGVDVLAIPAYGPWAALRETIDFARAVGATRGFCIHDRLLSEPGFRLVHGRLDAMTGTSMVDLRDGTPLSL